MSLRKNEILATIAEAYFKLKDSKLKFSIVQEESLKAYVTSKKQKAENTEFTLMKDNISYIEDIIPNKNSEETTNGNEGDNIGKNMAEIGEKDKFDFNLDKDTNPFAGVLIGGGIAAGAGAGAAVGSIAACIAFDSVFLMSTAGEIFAAGFTFLGGAAITGIGLVVAVPRLIGFGAYKIYKFVKDKDKKNFFESFNLEKMKIEREFQQYVICKIDDYFNKRIIIENNDEIEKYINNIIDIYLSIDKQIIESKLNLEQNQLLNKIKKDGKIVSINISKIRQELMKTILGYDSKKVVNILEQGIPLFKEFIKNFGPQKVDENNEKEIESNISKIIDIMKEILEKKMKVAFDKFDIKHFINSFNIKFEELYEDKKKLDNISKKDFISKCKDYIIEPIANNSKNYGVLSLFFKFTLLIQKIGAKKKSDNYTVMREKIINHNQSTNQNNIQNNIQNNGLGYNLNPNMIQNAFYQQNQMFQQPMPMFPQMYMMQGMMCPNLALNQNPAPLNQVMVNTALPLNKELVNNNNENLNQNQDINIKFIFNNRNIVIQGSLNMTGEELIQRFKMKLCDDNIVINKYLINDETELDPSSKITLKELGIKKKKKIMVS